MIFPDNAAKQRFDVAPVPWFRGRFASGVTRVWIVEDQQGQGRFYKRLLPGEGFEVESFAVGIDDFAWSQEESPEIIMYFRSNTLRLVAESPDLFLAKLIRLGTPVVVVADPDGEDDRVRVLDAGAAAYLSTTLSPRALAAHLRAILRLRQPTALTSPVIFDDITTSLPDAADPPLIEYCRGTQ